MTSGSSPSTGSRHRTPGLVGAHAGRAGVAKVAVEAVAFSQDPAQLQVLLGVDPLDGEPVQLPDEVRRDGHAAPAVQRQPIGVGDRGPVLAM
jgi:hypothetical protein